MATQTLTFLCADIEGPAAMAGRLRDACTGMLAGHRRLSGRARPGMTDNGPLLINLPAQVSSFVGREVELAAVRALVGGSRLVTLTGTGGAGKTRLALRVAAGLADDAGDGVWFADLAPLGDPDLVAVTVADVLGVRQEPGRPVVDTVAEAVGGRSLLVLLDNCEHVIGACAKVADALLRGCREPGSAGHFPGAAGHRRRARLPGAVDARPGRG